MAEPKARFNIDTLMRYAADRKASDLHLTVGRPPMIRLHGDLMSWDDLPLLTPEDTDSLAKQMIDEADWKKFVEAKELDLSVGRSGLARFRVNLYWQRGSVGIALRIIPHKIPSFEQLGLPDILADSAMADQGLFIVTGPTGSGKSTTLAAMVNHINQNRSCHIVTIEDPIEYLYRHDKATINQREMHHDTRSFHEALRHVLRQDPNVILIGEMRDLETIQTALTLAETGHLVLATLHTGDTTQAITRIVDSYPPYQQHQASVQLSLVLLGAMAQHLIRRRGGGTRVLAYEVLTVTPAVRHLIRSGEVQQIYSSLQTGGRERMCTLNNSLLRLCRAGLITREDAIHKSTRVKELIEQLASRS